MKREDVSSSSAKDQPGGQVAPGGEWLPIEGAPRNGAPVLLYLDPPLDTSDAVGYSVVAKLSVVVGWASDTWRDGVEWNCGFCEEGSADTEGVSSAFQMSVTPSHWMPLPEPPK